MLLSISAVVLLAAVVLITIRKGGHKVWHAIPAILFGFYLAKTSAAPAISSGVTVVVAAFTHLHT